MTFRSLPFKINTAIFTTALIVSIFFVIILYPLELKRGEEQIKRINVLLETVFLQNNDDLANELFANQRRALKATLAEIQTVDRIVGVDIYNGEGQLLLRADDNFTSIFPVQNVTQEITEADFQTVLGDGHYLGVYTNVIEVIGRRIGYIVIYYDLSAVKQETQEAATMIFILPLATVLLMAVLLNLFLFKSIIHPVSVLRNAMRRVEEGHLGETIALSEQDEIGDMGNAFNDMSRKLRVSHEALLEAEEKYRTIFENAIEGIFQYSPVLERFIIVNPSMAAILGYSSPEEAIRLIKNIHTQFFKRMEDWSSFDSILVGNSRIVGLEIELLTRDGDIIWASLSARKVSDELGETLYYEGTFVDITEQLQRKAAEQKQEAAESASQAKSDFLAKMSHEIRTPMNAILGFADILDSSVTDTKQKEYLQIIQNSGANLLTIINDILDLSKIEAGRMELRQSSVDLRTLIDELVNLFSVNALQKEVVLSASVAEDVPHSLNLDGNRLRQILFNLIGNAVKFTPKGTVKVECSAQLSHDQESWDVLIGIIDTGPGIQEDELQLVFQSFQQLDSGEKQVEGTGLGLAIVKSLVEMMGGEVEVTSQVGEGSTFSVALKGVASHSLVQESADTDAKERPFVGQKRFYPARILVVDDLEVNRHHVISTLGGMALTFLEAQNGLEAAGMVAAEQLDLVLMDIRMPELDGFGAIKLIRQHNIDVPVIAITAGGMKEDISKISEAGFDAYLIRPFFRTQLLDTLSSFLSYSIEPEFTTTSKESDDIGLRSEDEIEIQQWHCPEDLATLLQGHYLDMWSMICKKQRIPDIIQFATELRDLGNQYSVSHLEGYSAILLESAENFDIDRLRKSLKSYSIILTRMIVKV